MLQRVQIRNFKCLQNHEFELKPLTILAGANGSGKSSLIQAILMFQACYKTVTGTGVEKVFTQNIGAVSQLISQNFIDVQEATIIADIDHYSACLSLALSGSKKQRLIGSVKATDKEVIPQSSFPVFQYLNAERLGPRLNTGIGESDNLICPDGRNAAYLVDLADQEGFEISSDLLSEGEPIKFSYQVEKYLAAIMGDIKLYYEPDYDSAAIKTTLQTSAAERPVTPPLTGFGYSYAFPIVVAGLLCSCTCFPNMALIVENPEAHLHPSAQSNMGKFLALLAGCGVQVIVETHSEHIIDGARLQLAHEKKTDCMRVHFFSYDEQGTSVKQINVNQRGELTSWPKGFFDQKQKDLRELLSMK